MGEKIGYSRVSSTGQKLDLQIGKLSDAGVSEENIFCDKASGAAGRRDALEKMLAYVRRGDTVFVTRLDRLARSTAELLRIHDVLNQKQVALVVIDQAIDTTTATGRFLMTMLGAIAELEREYIRERTAEGKVLAAQRGIKPGRKWKLTDPQMVRLAQEFERREMSRGDLAKKYKVATSSLPRLIARGKALAAQANGVLPGQLNIFEGGADV